ncbi:hypothetical protein N9977_00385 [bacterium]|nr:hypothetical protein [bacterium]
MRTPQTAFFTSSANCSDRKTLVVSSPSRMGNHLLVSLLDGHPELPQTPGEDGFHMFSFVRAHYALHEYLGDVFQENPVDSLMNIASNGIGSKWHQFQQIHCGDFEGRVTVSGISVGQSSGLVDFEGVTFPIEFDCYKERLKKNFREVFKMKTYDEVLMAYQSAFALMQRWPIDCKFDDYFVYGGMRTQLKWLCEKRPNVKILSSIRSFPSFAVSQIKSRHGDVEITDNLLKTAWEHWFHKVVDILHLKEKHPEKIGLVSFDDLIHQREISGIKICDFLGIRKHSRMESATIFDHPVGGNSWQGRSKGTQGGVYAPKQQIEEKRVPPEAHELWDHAQKFLL